MMYDTSYDTSSDHLVACMMHDPDADTNKQGVSRSRIDTRHLTNFENKWDNISVVPALLTLPNFFSLSLSPMQEFGYRCCIVLNIRITLDFNSRGRNITVYRIQVIFPL